MRTVTIVFTTLLLALSFASSALPESTQTIDDFKQELKKTIGQQPSQEADVNLRNLLTKIDKLMDKSQGDQQFVTDLQQIKYLAFVNLCANEIYDKTHSKRDATKAYLLEAVMLDPGRPEAYMLLSQLENDSGDASKCDYYLTKAKQCTRKKPNAHLVCIEGLIYEDRGNYQAAAETFSKTLSPGSLYAAFDPYFMTQLARVFPMVLGERYNFWVGRVYANLLGSNYRATDESLRALMFKELAASLRGIPVDKPSKKQMLTKIGYDSLNEKQQAQPISEDELVRKFIASSYSFETGRPIDQRERENLEKKWKSLEDELKQHLSKVVGSDEEKVCELLSWLHMNLLQDYNVADGTTVQGVLDNKKFICMTGSVTYALMARSVGIESGGVRLPQHIRPIVKLGSKWKLLETTTRYPNIIQKSFKEKGLPCTPEQIVAEIKRPCKDPRVFDSEKDLIEFVKQEHERKRLKENPFALAFSPGGIFIDGPKPVFKALNTSQMVELQYQNMVNILTEPSQVMLQPQFKSGLDSALSQCGVKNPEEKSKIVEAWRAFGSFGDERHNDLMDKVLKEMSKDKSFAKQANDCSLLANKFAKQALAIGVDSKATVMKSLEPLDRLINGFMQTMDELVALRQSLLNKFKAGEISENEFWQGYMKIEKNVVDLWNDQKAPFVERFRILAEVDYAVADREVTAKLKPYYCYLMRLSMVMQDKEMTEELFKGLLPLSQIKPAAMLR
jgi:hypothetical protein